MKSRTNFKVSRPSRVERHKRQAFWSRRSKVNLTRRAHRLKPRQKMW